MYSTQCDEPKHITIAKIFVGQKEVGNNRSVIADLSNKFVGNKLGSPYCQATVSYVLELAYSGKYKKTGLATAFRGDKRISALDVYYGRDSVLIGDVITYQKGESIFGHAGFSIENWKGIKGMSFQANTTKRGESSNGQGVYLKPAEIQPFNIFRIKCFWRIYGK